MHGHPVLSPALHVTRPNHHVGHYSARVPNVSRGVRAFAAIGLLAASAVAGGTTATASAAAGDAASHGVARFFFDSRSTDQGLPRVYSMNPDGTGRRALTVGGSLMGALSPDGRHLLYWQTAGDAGNSRLVVADLDGRHPRGVTPANGYAYQPDWSPDGRQLAFGRGPGGPGTSLYVSTQTGAGVRPIPNTDEGTAPRYFPDGRHVVYMHGLNPCCLVYVIGTNGRGKRPVAGGRLVGFPDVSPDGKTLAFEVHRSTGSANVVTTGLATQSATGGRVHVLAAAGPCVKSPLWSPDGAVVFFVRCRHDAAGTIKFGADSLAEIKPDGTGMQILVPHMGEAAALQWLAQPASAQPTPSGSAAAPGVTFSTAVATPSPSRTQESASAAGTAKSSRSGPVAAAIAVLLIGAAAFAVVLLRRRSLR